MTHFLATEGLAIAARHGIPLTTGAQMELSDEEFAQFCSQYSEWSAQRDELLWNHVAATPTLFRLLLPNNTRLYATANQLAWYLDEAICRDRILGAIRTDKLPIEQRKEVVRQEVQSLASVRPILQEGYLLPYGEPIAGSPSDDPPDEIRALAADPAVREALRLDVYCGHEEGTASNGARVHIYQLSLEYGGIVHFDLAGMAIPPHSMVSLPPIPFRELPRMSYAKAAEALKADPLELLANLVLTEVQMPILMATAAARIGAAVLFDRTSPSVILERADIALDASKQVASVEALNLALPYIANTTPEELVRLRRSMPTAFRDFHAQLLLIINEAKTKGFERPEELKVAVDAKVLPILRNLDAEMKSSADRARILGYGSPTVAAVGGLVGGVLGLGPLAIATALTAGLATSLKASADYASVRAKAQGSPMYFLWRASK